MNTDLVEREATSIESLRQAPPQSALAVAETERAVAEVQAAMTIAKRFPRNEDLAYAKIMKACKRPGFAEEALYAYTKGGSEVSGPSIRLAEELARDWGNISFGWKILTQDENSSEVRAEAWDLETNVPAYIVFTVPHEFKAKGQIKKVSDPREVYELIANQASRRLRACVLRVIPGDVQDAAVVQCEKTLKDGGGKPLSDRIRDMLAAFLNDHGVTKAMVEKRVGKNAEAITDTELVALRRIYGSIRDGMKPVEEFFDRSSGGGAGTNAEDLKKPASAQTGGTAGAEQKAPPAQQPEPERKIDAPKTYKVVTERGRVLTEISYTPKMGEIIDHEKNPWRVIEIIGDRVTVKAGEAPPQHPAPPQPEKKAEDEPLEVSVVVSEIMTAESLDDLKEARELIKRIPEKDRPTATSLADTKENQLKGNKTPPKRQTKSIE